MQQIGIGGLPSRGYTNSLPYFSILGSHWQCHQLTQPVNDGHAQASRQPELDRRHHAMKFGVEEVTWFDDRFSPTLPATRFWEPTSFTGTFTATPTPTSAGIARSR